MINGDVIPETPAQVHVEITSTCNLACPVCPVHRLRRGSPLSKEEVVRVLREAAALRPEYVDFVNYNEPLQSRDFWDYADLLTELLGPGRLGLVTNGTIMSERIADRILALGMKQVVFSVDAFAAETYARVRPRWTSAGPVEDLGVRDLVYGNIETYLARVERSGTGRWPVIEMVVCEENAHEVEAVRDYWTPRLHNQILFINSTGRGGERAFAAPNANPCRVVLDGLWVLSDGRVVACCEDADGVDAVGSVREQSLAEIWNGPAIRRFRDCHLSGRKGEIGVCAACRTSQDDADHYLYPVRTNGEVLSDLRRRGVLR